MVFNSLNKFNIYNTTEYDLNEEIKHMKKNLKKCLKMTEI